MPAMTDESAGLGPVVAGIDGSEESFHALGQAVREAGVLDLLEVVLVGGAERTHVEIDAVQL